MTDKEFKKFVEYWEEVSLYCMNPAAVTKHMVELLAKDV